MGDVDWQVIRRGLLTFVAWAGLLIVAWFAMMALAIAVLYGWVWLLGQLLLH